MMEDGSKNTDTKNLVKVKKEKTKAEPPVKAKDRGVQTEKLQLVQDLDYAAALRLARELAPKEAQPDAPKPGSVKIVTKAKEPKETKATPKEPLKPVKEEKPDEVKVVKPKTEKPKKEAIKSTTPETPTKKAKLAKAEEQASKLILKPKTAQGQDK